MVYTKVFKIKTLNKLEQSKNYVENSEKITVPLNENSDHFKNLFPYVVNPDKTISRQLVSGQGVIDVYDAANEFVLTKLWAANKSGKNYELNDQSGKVSLKKSSLENKNAVLAYHFIQSFSPDDNLTAEEVHEIGRKTMMAMVGEEHEFIIATHTDHDHLHNHIVMNSTNMVTGKAIHFSLPPQKIFRKVSDEISKVAGAKIITPNPKNSHAKYTKYQVSQLYKNKIKQRLDFLMTHSNSLENFLEKAAILNLKVNFDGKYVTYQLLDEPQIKNTRDRALTKQEPNPYTLASIEEAVKQNDIVYSLSDVETMYEEKEANEVEEFDYVVRFESWQVYDQDNKGYYINVDFGPNRQKQVFLPGFKVDHHADNTYSLYMKQKDYFPIIGEKGKFLSAVALSKQLSLYSGHVPLKKEPVLTKLDEIIGALNFLTDHNIYKGQQLENMIEQLKGDYEDGQETLEKLGERRMILIQLRKSLALHNHEKAKELSDKIDSLVPLDEISLNQVEAMLDDSAITKNLLSDKLQETKELLSEFSFLKAAATQQKDREKM